jgi:dolichol-phosphate mannosyltransferase
LTGYGQRPQHLLGSFGLLAFMVGGTGIFLLTGWWAFSRIDNFLLWFGSTVTPEAKLEAQAGDLHLHDRAIFYYSIVSVLLGAQFMVIGFLAELITSHWAADHEPYLIRKRLE